MAQSTEERNTILNDKKNLQNKVSELKEKVIWKTLLQAVKHIIWDALSVEVTKFKPYLNYVNDKILIVDMAIQRCKVVNETMDKNPSDTSQNAIDFLNTLNYEYM